MNLLESLQDELREKAEAAHQLQIEIEGIKAMIIEAKKDDQSTPFYIARIDMICVRIYFRLF